MKFQLIIVFYEVYTKISYIEKACNVTRITATFYLNQLEDAETFGFRKNWQRKNI